MTFWYFFDKYNQAAEKKEESLNVKNFFKQYKSPQLRLTPESKQAIERLAQRAQTLRQ